ncbi:MAG: fimbrillin family protein [Rikenellaceae bacterium]
MKKHLLPVLLIVAVMSSCSKNDISGYATSDTSKSSDDITLFIATTTSRGADVTTSSLENASGGVDLHINDADSISDAYNFTATDSDWSQSSTSLKWSDITFPAYFYSMHDGDPQSLTMTDSTATLSYSVTGNSTDHKDMVYHASVLSSIPSSGSINAYHTHALSKMNIYAGTGTNKVYIAKATVMNVDGESIATISSSGIVWSDETYNDADYQYYYVGDDTQEALQSSVVDGVTVNPIINSGDSVSLMIIPQSLIGATVEADSDGTTATISGSYVEVIYYLTDSNDAALVGYSSVSARPDSSDYIAADQNKALYVKAAFPLTVELANNKQYNLILGLGMTGSTGGLLVDDFYVDKNGDPVKLTKTCDDTSAEVEIPDLEPGDEILGDGDDEIDIYVNVKDWDDAEGVSLY